MNQKLTFLSLTLVVLLLSNITFAQDNSNDGRRWNLPSTRANVGGVYPNLPVQNNYHGPTGTTRLYHTPNGDVLVPPNIIPFVTATATESEISASNMGGNNNTMYASWNSYGPSFYGTGFCLTTNGGATWTGNYNNMFSSNNGGDPGTWIWPTGSTWAGRLGASDLNGSYSACTAFYSTDNGVTWSNQVSLPPTGGVDKNLSCVDDVPGSPYLGRAYTLWSNFGQSLPPIVCCYSSDGGATYTASTGNVSPPSDGSHYCQGVDVQCGPGGVVYAVWAYNISGSPYTEDYMGFAKSTNGGVSWTGNNNAVNTNGIRTTNLYNGIRADGFPRIAVDKSGTGTNGNIYAVMSEKLVAPARDNADICLCRSTDGGTTWSHTLVNGDASGNYNWHGSPVVSNTGVLGIGYYDTRNTTVPVTQYYMSFSVNGGSSFSDIQVSDHNFTPAPISGLAGGYQGDYTGMTWGNGKFWPFWADPSSGHYQCWTAGVSTVVLAHDYACGPFLSLPVSPLLINTAYNIKTKVSNIGSSNETNVPIKFYVDGILINTTNLSLNVGQVDSVNNSWQTAVAGSHLLMYISALSTDLDRTNDTVRTTVNVVTSLPALCEQFASTTFPPTGWSVDGTWWGYNAASGFGVGTGSARFNAWSAPSGADNNLVTLTYAYLSSQNLHFDLAYSPYPATPPYSQDSLVVLGSTNGGTSYFSIARLGPTNMQTAPASNSEFTPTATQWVKKNYSVPNGTNRIDFLGRSQFGNDIFIDSVCVDGVTGISVNTNSVPKVYSLSQNYPNPFNPTTNISFDIPKAGLVKLVVFDILGREVETVVNEVKEPGNYKVNFNAANLASGVYFYRLDAGDFTSVKKMLLIK